MMICGEVFFRDGVNSLGPVEVTKPMRSMSMKYCQSGSKRLWLIKKTII